MSPSIVIVCLAVLLVLHIVCMCINLWSLHETKRALEEASSAYERAKSMHTDAVAMVIDAGTYNAEVKQAVSKAERNFIGM